MKLIIVGYGPGGASAAIAARMFDSKADIKLITEETIEAHRKPGASLALEFPDTDELNINDWSFDALSRKRIDILSGTSVVSVDSSKKLVEIRSRKENQKIPYDRLILATGGIPNIPNISGTDLPGVFTIQNLADTSKIGSQLSGMNCIAIVGAGLSGLETAERLLSLGKEVYLIVRSRLMRRQLEESMSSELLSRLPQNLIIHMGSEPSRVFGNGKVEGLTLDGNDIKVDAVLFMTGVRPNVKLAKEIGLKIGELGGILVNQRMQTSNNDIFAVGDCVEMIDSLTNQPLLLPVGSVAARAGRQAGVASVGGTKIYSDTSKRLQYDRIFGTDIICIGHSSTTAKNVGIKMEVTYFEDSSEYSKVSLISNDDGVLIGGQVISPRLGARLGYEILDRVEAGSILRDNPLSRPRHERLREFLEQTYGPIR